VALQVAVVTLFPELVRGASEHGVLGRALARGLAGIECVDPRQYASDAHRTVDDRPYGGGPGMVGTPAPWAAAIDAAVAQSPAGVPRIHLSAQGERFDQGVARELAAMPGFVLVASRYEGLDQRVIDARIDRELSLGDFILSGGEFAALAVIDAVVRLLPGALGDERSNVEESFSAARLDWPHYTRPVEWEGREVPQVLQGKPRGDRAVAAAGVGGTHLRASPRFDFRMRALRRGESAVDGISRRARGAKKWLT